MSVRIYVPATLSLLRDWHAAGELPASSERVVAGPAGADVDEEAEYAALMTAADASTALAGGAGRRVVVVAEVASGGDVEGVVPLRDVVAVHADAHERPADADPDEDLGWYATQEIPALLRPGDGFV